MQTSAGAALSAAGPRQLDDYAVAAVGTPQEAVIRRWLAGLFAFAVRTGERHLEEGRPGTAAASFADAALLTDRAGRFSAAVRRAYPDHFYRLYERRVTVMGLGHVLEPDAAPVEQPHGRSPVEGSDDDDDDFLSIVALLYTIQEEISYKIRIHFIVQQKNVHSLKYVKKTYCFGVPVDKIIHMVGSYQLKLEIQSHTKPAENAPRAMMARGSYTIHFLFTDDDKNEHLKWEW